MDTVNHAISNISDEQKELFIRECATAREHAFGPHGGAALVAMSATPNQHKPTKAEKKQAKRERRMAYGERY